MDNQAGRNLGYKKLTKTKAVSIRLDEKLYYLTELAALKQRRSISSFIEWAIEKSLTRVKLQDDIDNLNATRISSEAEELWDVDESSRFVKLATNYPELLKHEQQILWKLLREKEWLWMKPSDESYEDTNAFSSPIEDPNTHKRLREDVLKRKWKDFVAVARGEADEASLSEPS